MRKNTISDFLDRIVLIPFHTCWEWGGGNFNSGYGRFAFSNKMVTAHKFSYKLHKGEVPEGLFVMHSCDNKNCVNPAHLSLGTPLDNTIDMMRKGRNVKTLGRINGRVKLTEQQVLDIRAEKMLSGAALAKKYLVSPSLISLIRSKKVWGHL